MPGPALVFWSISWPRLMAGPLNASVLAAGPDQLELLFAFDLDEAGVDRGGEARIVQLDREVVAAFLLRDPLPGGAELDILRCTAKR